MKIKPEIITHKYPIIPSDTERFAHTGVPKSVTQSSYTKQLQMDVIRRTSAVDKCISTLENEDMDEVRTYAASAPVHGGYNLSQTLQDQNSQFTSITTRKAQKITLQSVKVWKIKVKLMRVGAASGTVYVRVRDAADNIEGEDTIAATSLNDGTLTWYEFTLSTATLPNDTYYLSVEYDYTGGNVWVGQYFGNVVTGVLSNYTSGAWVDSPSHELSFEVSFYPTTYLKVYKNGIVDGSEFSNDGTVTLSDDLGPYDPGDSIELWGWIDNTTAYGNGTHTASISEYKLKYDWDSTKIKGDVTYS